MRTLFLLFVIGFCACAQLRSPELYATRSHIPTTPYFYTNIYGHRAFDENYQEAGQFVGDLAAVRVDMKWGYIDRTGRVAIPLEYDWCSSFGEYGFDRKIAIVKYGTSEYKMPIITPCPTVLINTRGERISPLYGFLLPSGSGLFIVNSGRATHRLGRNYSAFDGKWGCVNTKGREVVPCIYDFMYPFTGPVTFVKKGDKWGVLSDKGKLIVPCAYDSVHYESDNCVRDTYTELGEIDPAPGKTYIKDCIYMTCGVHTDVFDTRGRKIK